MNPSELFDLWAPPAAVWSKWAKPVLFAELGAVPRVNLAQEPLPAVGLLPNRQTALVIDLPSTASVRIGLALAEIGFRPVPLYNGVRGPSLPNIGASAILDNDAIVAWLLAGASILTEHHLPFDAPPAFLLDSKRKPQINPAPGRFDNRWIVFPQDFPSAAFLRAHGIAQVLLAQENVNRQPQEDLAHVLRRWQEAGLPLFTANLESSAEPQPLLVNRPSRFRALWYSALARIGLRRNSAGGFGSVVPQPSSGAG